ncbi:MAG TPA: PAS domain S-box protein, partial [Anaerolineales bacterium]|nr:PAS domain S-box protein [Anaerolineales bacterium]
TETGQTIIVHDTHSYPGWHRMQITDWLHSNVGAPILIQGKVIGFILLDSKTVGFFTPVHAERLEAFANQAALAINNANILQQAQEEIAERKRAEEKLRASEERFRQMADNIEEVFWMTDALTGEELYMSPASEKVWGRTPEYLMQNSTTFMDNILPEDRPVVQRGVERERAGEKVEMEYRITRPDGTVRWIWDRAFPVFDEKGQVKILAGIAADITERKQAVEALRESENKANALLNALPDLMFRMDLDGRILSYKAESADLYNQIDSLINKQLHDIATREFADLIDHYIRLTLESGEMQVFEYQLPIPERGLLDYEARMVASGNNEVIAIVRDITERKKAEDALRESEARFSNAFEFAPIGIALVSLQGNWLKVNRSLCDLLGYTAEELYQKTFQEITHPEDLEADLNSMQPLIHGEINSYQMEKRYFHKAGHIVWVLLSVSLVKDSDGNPAYAISQIQDITQRKQAEDEISRRAEETSALLATSMALTNLDLHAILNSVGNSAKALFMADGCRIFLVQPDGESLRCVLALQEDAIAFTDLRVRLGEGVTGAVAASGLAEIVNTMQDDPRAIQVPGTQEEEEAIMFAPLRERDRTLGVLSVRRAGTDRPFEPEDLEFLEAFASMAASAVSNARLFEETQRRLSELEALYENGLAVGQLLEPRQIGERIIETFARHLSWHHVAIRLLREGTDELELIAFNQPDLSEKERSQAVRHFNSKINRVGQGLSGWVVQTGQPIRSGNVYDYPQYVSTYPGILSGLYMPLKIGERVIGVISVESEEAEALTAQDERLLATLANQAAIAFENARL